MHDVDAAFEMFTQRLGFPVSWPVESQAAWRNGAVWLGNCSLELLTPVPGATAGGAFFGRALASRGEGLFLIAFEPDSFDRAVEALNANGVPNSVYVSPRGEEARQYRSVFFASRATGGAQCFFCEYDPPFVPVDGGRGDMKVKKLDHVVIATGDLDDALQRWEQALGLKPDAALDRPLGAGFKVARLPIGDAFLELVQPVATEGRFYEQVQERGEGLFSISVEVDDLDEAVGYLRGKGVKVSGAEPSIWPGARLARISREDTHGVSIQLIERK